MRRMRQKLIGLGACGEAVEWAARYQTEQEAWDSCQRGDWLLWYAGRYAGEPGSQARKRLVLAACACARVALPLVAEGETRPRVAIETAERWARGDGATLDDVTSAAYAAYAAASAAYYAYAASSAAYAADAAYSAAAYSAYSADAATRREMLATYADIVRGYYPTPPE